MAIRVIVKIRAAKGKGEEVAASTGANLATIRQEDGCEEYALFRSVEDGDEFVMVERWATQNALDAHLAIARARQAESPTPTMTLRIGTPVMETFEIT